MSSRVRLVLSAAIACAVALSLAACSQPASDAPPAAPADTATTQSPPTGGETVYTPAYKPTGDEVAVFKTSKGTIKVKLFGNDAPIHVGNFVELAEKGFYDNVKFHRLNPWEEKLLKFLEGCNAL